MQGKCNKQLSGHHAAGGEIAALLGGDQPSQTCPSSSGKYAVAVVRNTQRGTSWHGTVHPCFGFNTQVLSELEEDAEEAITRKLDPPGALNTSDFLRCPARIHMPIQVALVVTCTAVVEPHTLALLSACLVVTKQQLGLRLGMRSQIAQVHCSWPRSWQ